ncbi:DUF7269 family protein [Salinirubrum litoreum]|uniref:Uncharacterized protein n=1 Tax=Salinirubrum litoreum TaxID=1126234 RepID=A0ABD5R978_9EURY|nr:hypothetical protein [Salinirubrum litoreum]
MNRVALLLGVVTTLFGLAVVVQRGLASTVSLDYLFVTLVGLLALVQGVRLVNERRSQEAYAAETGDPEVRFSVPTPGDELESELQGLGGWAPHGVEHRKRARQTLYDAAVETLVTQTGVSEETAEERVDDGSWTDDPVAARFLSRNAPEVPLGTRIRGLLSRGSAFSRGAQHTVDALVRLQEGDR